MKRERGFIATIAYGLETTTATSFHSITSFIIIKILHQQVPILEVISWNDCSQPEKPFSQQ
jgi:hypothetical protein